MDNDENVSAEQKEGENVFENATVDSVSTPDSVTTIEAIGFAPSTGPYAEDPGLLKDAQITVANGVVRVVVLSRMGSANITEVPVPIAAAWLMHLSANPAFETAKALQP